MKVELRHAFLVFMIFFSAVAATEAEGIDTAGIGEGSPDAASPRVESVGVRTSQNAFVNLLSYSETLSVQVSQLVGYSISPLMAMSMCGSYSYLRSDEQGRRNCAWYNHPYFWASLLLLLGLVCLKDVSFAQLPFLAPFKKPLDALEVLENKSSGLIALPVVFSSILDAEYGQLAVAIDRLSNAIVSNAYANEVLSQTPFADPVTVLKISLLILIGTCVFCVVWMVSHAINVLIVLCPFTFIDVVLKGMKVVTIAVLVGARHW